MAVPPNFEEWSKQIIEGEMVLWASNDDWYVSMNMVYLQRNHVISHLRVVWRLEKWPKATTPTGGTRGNFQYPYFLLGCNLHDSENVLLKTTKKTCFTITIKQIDRVVIYHVHNHLCSRIISVDGTIWYNDNITTSNNSIQDGHLSTMNYEELKTCNEKDLYLLYMYNLLLRKK